MLRQEPSYLGMRQHTHVRLSMDDHDYDRTEGGPARSTIYNHEKWEKHRQTVRYARHVLNIPFSKVFRALLVPVIAVMCSALIVGTWETARKNGGIPHTWPHLTVATGQPFALTAFALSLLLVFRTNTSYDRWWEARKLLGGMLNRSIDFVRQAMLWFPEDQPHLRALVTRYTIAYNCCLCNLLHGQHGHNDDLRSTLVDVLKPGEVDQLMQCSSRVNFSLQVMSEAVRAARMSDICMHRMDDNLSYFQDVVGACIRILQTPIPLSYTRHTSRFLILWLLLLPTALWDSCSWTSVPISGCIAFLMLGIDEIGVQIEEPFGILPLRQICDVLKNTVQEMMERHGSARALVIDAAAGITLPTSPAKTIALVASDTPPTHNNNNNNNNNNKSNSSKHTSATLYTSNNNSFTKYSDGGGNGGGGYGSNTAAHEGSSCMSHPQHAQHDAHVELARVTKPSRSGVLENTPPSVLEKTPPSVLEKTPPSVLEKTPSSSGHMVSQQAAGTSMLQAVAGAHGGKSERSSSNNNGYTHANDNNNSSGGGSSGSSGASSSPSSSFSTTMSKTSQQQQGKLTGSSNDTGGGSSSSSSSSSSKATVGGGAAAAAVSVTAAGAAMLGTLGFKMNAAVHKYNDAVARRVGHAAPTASSPPAVSRASTFSRTPEGPVAMEGPAMPQGPPASGSLDRIFAALDAQAKAVPVEGEQKKVNTPDTPARASPSNTLSKTSKRVMVDVPMPCTKDGPAVMVAPEDLPKLVLRLPSAK